MIIFDPYGALFNVYGVMEGDRSMMAAEPDGTVSPLAGLVRSAQGDFSWVRDAVDAFATLPFSAERRDFRRLLPHVCSLATLERLHAQVCATDPDEALRRDLVNILIRSGAVGALRLAREEIAKLGTQGEEYLFLSEALVVGTEDPAALAPNPFEAYDDMRHFGPDMLRAEWRRTWDTLFGNGVVNGDARSGILLGRPVDLRYAIETCLNRVLPERLDYRFVEIRPYLEATTGVDLSECFTGREVDPNVSRHVLEELYDMTDLDAFERGVRYFFGHRLEG